MVAPSAGELLQVVEPSRLKRTARGGLAEPAFKPAAKLLLVNPDPENRNRHGSLVITLTTAPLAPTANPPRR